MGNEVQVTLRLPEEDVERVDRIAQQLGHVRSETMRQALRLGAEVLEQTRGSWKAVADQSSFVQAVGWGENGDFHRVAEQFHFHPRGSDDTVLLTITEDTRGVFSISSSHYAKGAGRGGPYRPSDICGRTPAEALRKFLHAYDLQFTGEKPESIQWIRSE